MILIRSSVKCYSKLLLLFVMYRYKYSKSISLIIYTMEKNVIILNKAFAITKYLTRIENN